MRFLLDENVERRIAEHLEATGHDVAQATSVGPAPLSDHEVVRTALRPGRILVTRNRDFGQLVFELGDTCPTMLLRFKTNEPRRWFTALDTLLNDHAEELDCSFVTLTEQVARIRSLPGSQGSWAAPGFDDPSS